MSKEKLKRNFEYFQKGNGQQVTMKSINYDLDIDLTTDRKKVFFNIKFAHGLSKDKYELNLLLRREEAMLFSKVFKNLANEIDKSDKKGSKGIKGTVLNFLKGLEKKE